MSIHFTFRVQLRITSSISAFGRQTSSHLGWIDDDFFVRHRVIQIIDGRSNTTNHLESQSFVSLCRRSSQNLPLSEFDRVILPALTLALSGSSTSATHGIHHSEARNIELEARR